MSTLSDTQLLDVASDAVFKRIQKGAALQALSWPEQVIALVYCGQAVIDNGGLLYFFERNWPDDPPYLLFAEAYRAIGVDHIGRCIAAVAAGFPFPEPHLQEEARQAYLDEHYADETGPLAECDEFAVSSEEVYARLAIYARDQGLGERAA